MIEAVGADYWPTYFAALDALLKPGGRVALQSITMPHERMLVSRRAYTWINKHIFPGGLIPSIDAIEATLAEHTGLRITQRRDHGLDYARTLRCWRQRFLAQWETVAALGFDDTFRRTWEYYLAYCEAGFRTGYIDVSLIQLQRHDGPAPAVPLAELATVTGTPTQSGKAPQPPVAEAGSDARSKIAGALGGVCSARWPTKPTPIVESW